MTLYINTTEFHNLELALIKAGGVKTFRKNLAFNENFKTLELIEQFLKKQKVALKDLHKIIVCSGPGSFTGIRVGVALAQALGIGLNIPVQAIPKNKIPSNLVELETMRLSTKLTLHYGAKPNITKPKKKTRS
ncbi:MAG TPA: tRNA (adenosine(37)-N6)-threonylcarbamoyltransferase complex dimerization subunit type 1 TsaB [Candidatus Doudnabacteria bacterium]|nr:tRNA (adenosine(37)-N6)-threonylcarbamoyltransferase complex dimerization subunit type 1 TsaB [Candidatus Doudnabacteria bacterium]